MMLSAEEIKNIKLQIESLETPKYEGSPKVSVIIPAYNTEKYISKCLLSLIKQTLKEIEIIVVNDGSTDNTAEITALFANHDSRVKLLHQDHLKQGAARNLGMSSANGEFIGYVDSDDWVDEDFYEKLYNAATKTGSDIALAANIRIGSGKTKKRLNLENETVVTLLQDKIDISKQYKNPCPTNKIYKRTMLLENNINWEEGVFCEDKLFTMKAVYYANAIVTVPDVYYYYFRNPHSTVKTKTKEHVEKLKYDKNNAKLSVIKFLREKHAELRDKEIWAVENSKYIFNIPFIVKKISIHTAKYLLFGIIPIIIVREQ